MASTSLYISIYIHTYIHTLNNIYIYIYILIIVYKYLHVDDVDDCEEHRVNLAALRRQLALDGDQLGDKLWGPGEKNDQFWDT